jgi:hypothetical protein
VLLSDRVEMTDIQTATSIRDDIGPVVIFYPVSDRGRAWLVDQGAMFKGGFAPEWEQDQADLVISCAADDGLVVTK